MNNLDQQQMYKGENTPLDWQIKGIFVFYLLTAMLWLAMALFG